MPRDGEPRPVAHRTPGTHSRRRGAGPGPPGPVEGNPGGYRKGRTDQRSPPIPHDPLELAFAYFEASQTQRTSSAETAGRLEQARTAALLSIAESLAVLAAASIDVPTGQNPATG